MTISSLLTSAIILFMPLWQGDCDLVTWWYYVIETKEIYICTPLDDDMEFYKNHELGHYVWNSYMNDRQRKNYTKLYNRAMTQGIKSFYREYGMTDVEEDFSENFALMIMKEKIKAPQLQYRINHIRTLFKIL